MARYRLQMASLLVLLVNVIAGPALGCTFHTNLPAQTVADILVDSAVVVVARADPSEQFAYVPVEVWKGTAPDRFPNVFVDSVTRRRLAANPADGVLLAQAAPGELLRRVVYLDDETRPTMRAIMENAASWRADTTGAERFRFFAQLLDDPHPVLRRLSLSELDRVQYAYLRTLDVRTSAATLRFRISNIREVPWAPVRILLLGIRGDQESRQIVGEKIERAAQYGSAIHLGAWATAGIEASGTAGIKRLADLFLSDPAADPQQIDAVLTALAVHGAQGDPALRETIDEAISDLVSARPGQAGAVARAFAGQGDYSRAELLVEALDGRRPGSPMAAIQFATYLSLSRQASVGQ